jgi:hypothetical protein
MEKDNARRRGIKGVRSGREGKSERWEGYLSQGGGGGIGHGARTDGFP